MRASSFRPAWWLPGSHLQTLWPNLIRGRRASELQRERLELPDGDFLDLDWTPAHDGPLAIILHGLEGSSRSHYARGIVQALQQRGWRCVVVHFRGCSGVPNRLARGYHAGDTFDFDYVVKVLRARDSSRALAAVGYSLGGNVLLKWLGEQGFNAPLLAAAAVSVPFDLRDAALRLNTGLSRFYQWVLLRSLRISIQRKDKIDAALLTSLHSLRDFDEHVTAPLHGFKNADDYYAKSSCREFLHGIRVPTLIVHALDDPFMTPAALPTAAELSPLVEMHLTAAGGHVGFVSGPHPWRARYFHEQRISDFFFQQLAASAAINPPPR